jgi:hypothetical protein
MNRKESICFSSNKVWAGGFSFNFSCLFTNDLLVSCPWDDRAPWSYIFWSADF